MRRKTFDALVSVGGLILAVVLLVAGGLLMWGYSFANGQMHDQLVAITSFIGAGLLLILSITGLVHGRRVPAETEVLAKTAHTRHRHRLTLLARSGPASGRAGSGLSGLLSSLANPEGAPS